MHLRTIFSLIWDESQKTKSDVISNALEDRILNTLRVFLRFSKIWTAYVKV